MAEEEHNNETNQEQLKPLLDEIETQRTRAATAEKERAEANQRLVKATDQQLASREEAVNNAIEATKAEASAAEAEYMRAMENADYKAAATAQTKIAQIAAKAVQLSSAKEQVSSWKQDWESKREVYEKAPNNNNADPLAAFSPASRAWVSQRLDKWKDPSYQEKVIRAHHKAIGEGLSVDTPEYFALIETQIGERRNQPQQDDTHNNERHDEEDTFEVQLDDDHPAVELKTEPPQREKKNPAPGTAAPVTRTLPPQAGAKKGAIKLTAREMEAAKFSFPDEYKENPNKAYAAYARNKAEIASTHPEVYNQ